MRKLILVILSVISTASCNEFIVLNTPESIEFKGTSDLPAESLSEVLSATLGYSVQTSFSIWDGLFVNDPFNTAKSVVSIVVEAVEDLQFKSAKTFNLVGEETNFEDAFLSKVKEHSHLAIDVDLVNNDKVKTLFGNLEKSSLEDDVTFLKPKTDNNHKEFLNQIAYLQSLIKLFTEEKEKPTALNVHVSLKGLTHSDSSAALTEASKLLTTTIEQLKAAVVKSFEGNTVFVVVTVEERHVRSKRQAAAPAGRQTDKVDPNPFNLAKLTSKNYPVVFNIMFWFTLIFVFALIAISLALSNVEDKDSIIYRMTGARGKKDN